MCRQGAGPLTSARLQGRLHCILFAWLALLAYQAQAQTMLELSADPFPHGMYLRWSISATATGYNVYRAPGNCLGSPSFANIASMAGESYYDPGLAPGAYCYYVTALNSGGESAPSNLVTGVAP
jgi:hypothetical protein